MTEAMTLVEISNLSSYELAALADCGTPDTLSSPGARLLDRVRDGVLSLIDEGRVALDDFNDDGQLHELCDDAPSVYTHGRWQQFLDLGAYDEQPDSDEWPDDLTKAAGVALYQICERLAYRLCESWAAGWTCPRCTFPTDEHGCSAGEDGCQSPMRALADMVAERQATLAAEAVSEAPEVPVEPLPHRVRGQALAEACQPAEAVLTGPVSDPVLDLIERAEASDMGYRVSRAAGANDRAVSRFRRRVWTAALVLAMVAYGVLAFLGSR